MSIDAMAVLKIPKLKAPPTQWGTTYLVYHRGDCSLLYTMAHFHGAAPEELALLVRQILGDALDAHADPRGVFLYPDVCEPRSDGYDAIIAELESAGVWAPKVAADHVPDPIAVEAHHERSAAQHEAIQQRVAVLYERTQRGEPMISPEEVSSFFSSGAATSLLESFGPGLKEELGRAMRGVDIDALDDNDLGKQMAKALGLPSPASKKKKKRAAKRKPGKKKAKAPARRRR
jgi:hypothetical protein